MSKVLVTKEKLDNLAEVISVKCHEDIPLTIDQMADAVYGYEETKIINQSKTVTPSERTQIVKPSKGYTGLDQVTVNPIPEEYMVNNQSLNVTPSKSRQTFAISDSEYTGFNPVTVYAIPDQYIVPDGTINITDNTAGIDIREYKTAKVNVVPDLNSITVTPTTETQVVLPQGNSTMHISGTRTVNTSQPITMNFDFSLENNKIYKLVGKGTLTHASIDSIYNITIDSQYVWANSPTSTGSPTYKVVTHMDDSAVNNNVSLSLHFGSPSFLQLYWQTPAYKTVYLDLWLIEMPYSYVHSIAVRDSDFTNKYSYDFSGLSIGDKMLIGFQMGSYNSWDDTKSYFETYTGNKLELAYGQQTAAVTLDPENSSITVQGYYSYFVLFKETATVYEGLSDVTVNPIPSEYQIINNQDKTVTPSETQQTITADSGYTGLGTVTVNSIPSEYIVPSGSQTITTNGTYDITDKSEVVVSTPVINNQNKTVTPTTTQQEITADTGYSGLGTVSVLPTKIDSLTITPSSQQQIFSGLVDQERFNLASGSRLRPGFTQKQNNLSINVDVSDLEVGHTYSYSGSFNYSNTDEGKLSISGTIVWSELTSGQHRNRIYYNETAARNTNGLAAITFFNDNSTVSLVILDYTTPEFIYVVDPLVFTETVSLDGYLPVTVNAIPSEYVVPTGTLSITQNGTSDVTNYASVNVSVPATVPSLQSKTATYTPSETQQTATITADSGYDGLDSVDITVNAVSNTYVGSAIDRRDETDLTASGATITVPAGYYAETESKAVATGVVVPTSTLTGSSATVNVNTATHTLTLSKNLNNMPTVTTPGYITQGSAGTTAVTLSTTNLESIFATTYTPSTSAQTLLSTGLKYVVGEQTLAGDENLVASNIKTGVSIFGVSGSYSGEPPVLQSKTATPTESQQTISPDSGYDGLSSVTVNAVSSTYVGSAIDRRDETDLTASGATVTVPAGYYAETETKTIASGSATTPATAITANPTISVGSDGLITASVTGSKSVTPTVSAGYITAGTSGTISVSGSKTSQLSTQAATTITPTESEQTAVAAGKYTTGIVKVGAISSTYVGSDITVDPTPTVSGRTVTIPTGYYSEDTTAQVSTGSATTPATTITANPTISVGSDGLIAASVTGSKSVTPTVSAGYISAGTAGTVSVSGSNTSQLSTQAATTVTPTESEQTAVAAGKYTTGAVKVGAISSTYVGTGITRRSSTDLTASGATVTVPAGYYSAQASKAVASGSAGTPSASKGTVSNHSISVTPSVTNTTGYITGGTKTGTAVTVSASELVSGTLSVTENGTTDVTNYASVNVNIPFVTYYTGTSDPASSLGSNNDIYLKVSS